MVTISQLVLPGDGPSQTTKALSAVLFVGILLLVITLPAAFFRVKIQHARERSAFRNVRTFRIASRDGAQSLDPNYRWRESSPETSNCRQSSAESRRSE